MSKILLFLPFLFISFSFASWHGPIGVMGDHTHGGENSNDCCNAGSTAKSSDQMFSLRHMYMGMKSNQIGSNLLSSNDVNGLGYMVAPVSMEMRMDMFGYMRKMNSDSTFMLMIPRIELMMNHRMRNGRYFQTSSSGIGDISLSVLRDLKRNDRTRSHIGLTIFLPTGSITKMAATPMNPNARMPYPMQLGSGTYDLLPSYTTSHKSGSNIYGFQVKAKFRTGRNKEGYTLGNKFESSAWIKHELCEKRSVFTRISYEQSDQIHGRDFKTNPAMVPTADPDLREGRKILAGFGFEWKVLSGELSFEYLFPIQQDLTGPQLAEDSRFIIGYRASF